MAERQFPRQNLNPSSAPWGREVERQLVLALRRLDQIDSGLGGTKTTALRALRKLGADPLIYRHNGILVPGDVDEYAITHSDDAENDSDGSLSSLNLNPERAIMRATSGARQTGFVLAAPNLLQLGIGQGLRWEQFRRGAVGVSVQLGANGKPQVNLALTEAPVLQLGYEADTTENTNGQVSIKRHPYMEFFGDTAHRIRSFADFGAATVPPASEETPGRVAYATDAETITGTLATKATTPRGVKKAIDAAIAKIPAGGGGSGGGKNVADYWRGDWVQP